MKKKSNYKKSLRIITQIQNIRKKNNTNTRRKDRFIGVFKDII